MFIAVLFPVVAKLGDEPAVREQMNEQVPGRLHP